MGQTQSHNFTEQQYDIVKAREDGSALLRHKKTKEQFLLRSVCCNMGDEVNGFQELIRKRQSIKSPHLLELLQINKKEEKNVCSVINKMYLLIEFPFETLRDYIQEKIYHGRTSYFSEEELWSILYSCCVGLQALYDHKIQHESLTSSDIYINKEGLIKISDPILLGLEKNYIKILKKDSECVHVSPEIMNFLDDFNFSYYDKEKSDIFILGAIMLEACTLRKVQFFNKQLKKPLIDEVPKCLNQARKNYSPLLIGKLERMLNFHSKLRPSFRQLIDEISRENNFDTEARSESIHMSSHSKASGHKSQPGSAQNSQTKSGQNNQPGSGHNMQVSKVHRIETISSNLHPPTANKDQETIIRLLNSGSAKPISQFALPQPQHNPQAYNPVYNASFSYSSNFPISTPQTNRSGGTNKVPHNSSNNSYQYNTSMQPTYSHAQHKESDERFSYKKFGNISLSGNANSRQPLFSHEIPEINAILKSHVPSTQPYSRGNFQVTGGYGLGIPVSQPTKVSYDQKLPMGPRVQPGAPKMSQSVGPTVNSSPSLSKTNSKLFMTANQFNNTTPSPNNGQAAKNENKVSAKVQEPNQRKSVNEEKITADIANQRDRVRIREPQKSPGPPNKSQESASYQHLSGEAPSQLGDGEARFVSMVIEGGGKYQGYIRNGMKNGQGRLEYEDGGFYTGEWKDNKMHGYGKLHYENGQIAYEGQWVDDLFCGLGRVFNDKPEKLLGPFNYHDFADLGDKWIYYQGCFENDSKHGKGKIRLTNGEVFEGTFVYDSIEGEGVFYTVRGEAIAGVWKDNMLIEN